MSDEDMTISATSQKAVSGRDEPRCRHHIVVLRDGSNSSTRAENEACDYLFWVFFFLPLSREREVFTSYGWEIRRVLKIRRDYGKRPGGCAGARVRVRDTDSRAALPLTITTEIDLLLQDLEDRLRDVGILMCIY